MDDICNFITRYYIPIQESSPHIYLSALPFSPTQSIVYKKYTTVLQNKVKVLNGPESWNVNNLTISGCNGFRIIFQPNSNVICSASHNGLIQFWDSYSGCSLSLTFKGQMYPISGLAISSHQSTLYSSSGCTITAWNLSTGQQLFQPLSIMVDNLLLFPI